MKNLDRFIPLVEFCELLSVHKATAYRNAGRNGFPDFVEITPGRVGVRESAYIEYAQNRPSIRQPPQAPPQAAIESPVPSALAGPEPASAPPKKRGRPRKASGGRGAA